MSDYTRERAWILLTEWTTSHRLPATQAAADMLGLSGTAVFAASG